MKTHTFTLPHGQTGEITGDEIERIKKNVYWTEARLKVYHESLDGKMTIMEADLDLYLRYIRYLEEK